MYRHSVRQNALEMREQGFSYNFISEKLGIAKSTLILWLKDVPFSINDKKIGRRTRSDKNASINAALNYSKEVLGALSDREVFLIGLGIYIGEGSKTYNILRISNSEPRVIHFAILWLKRSFGLSNENIRVRLHLYPDSDQESAILYWKNELSIDSTSFYPSIIDKRTDKKISRDKKLKFGTAHLSVVSKGNKNFGILLHRKILATIDRALNAGLV